VTGPLSAVSAGCLTIGLAASQPENHAEPPCIDTPQRAGADRSRRVGCVNASRGIGCFWRAWRTAWNHRCMGAWLVYWRQNMPGYDNKQKDDDGKAMKNWWPFLFY
jgi:hypothetical protein